MNLPSGSAILNDRRPLPGGQAMDHCIDTIVRLLPTSGVEPPVMQFYVRKNRLGPGRLHLPMQNMLSRHGPGEFNVISAQPSAPCELAPSKWVRLGSGWSMDAEPGNWVQRIYGGNMVEARPPTKPDGMVVGVLSQYQTDDPKRFLILWFR